MTTFILHLCLISVYLIIGAYATTDTSRLIKGAILPVTYPYCHCPYCNTKISLRHQIPIFSYMKSHGQCRICHHRINRLDILPEILLPTVFVILTYPLRFNLFSFILCIILFEGYKIIMIIYYHPREEYFFRNFLISFLYNIVIFSILGFIFILINIQ
jgi:prepilin signal peptidase PulO-like enzyme (type II secretory pathway)